MAEISRQIAVTNIEKILENLKICGNENSSASLYLSLFFEEL